VTAVRTIRDPRAAALQGGRAGFVSRLLANSIDLVVLEFMFFGCLLAVAVVRFLLRQGDFEIPAPEPAVTVAVQWSLLVLYLAAGWCTTGRTVGKSVFGLRVTDAAGTTLRPARAFLRAVLCASFYPGLLWIVPSRTNASLQDIVVRSRVVYDWSAAPTPLPPVQPGTP
jgi:uncharacterized RDD family membrane protein YckC